MNFEALLAAEGLAPLDCDNGRGGVTVSHRGNGRSGEERSWDEVASRELDLELLRTYRFKNARDKDLWRRHCEGQGYQKIARETRRPEKYVRVLFARVTKGRLRGGLEDTGGLPEPKRRTQGARARFAMLRRNLLQADPGLLAGLVAVLV